MGVKLHGEKGYTRFAYLAQFLVRAGYEVDLITSSFQHWEKRQRDIEAIDKSLYPFGLHFIYEPGYKKNVDPRRIYSHHLAAKNLRTFLEEREYDLVYAEIPPNDVALAAARYAKDRQIPFVADVNDLWPEAMRMVLDIPVLSNILFYPLARQAKAVYKLVSGVVGTSEEYRMRPFRDLPENAADAIPSATVYVGNEIAVFDAGASAHAGEIRKVPGEFRVGYAGTIGTSYDIRTMVLAAGKLQSRAQTDARCGRVRFVIMGDGPLRAELEAMAADLGLTNLCFTGYMEYGKMAAGLSACDVLVNSFVKKAPQSIVTKIGDYLAAGRPMINTCSSPEFRDKVYKDGFGINIVPEDADILADAILKFVDDPVTGDRMGARARAIAEQQFDRPTAYRRIETLIEGLLSNESK